MRRDGKWFETVPEPNTIMMNIGDLMQRWTADKFVSTVRIKQHVAVPARLNLRTDKSN